MGSKSVTVTEPASTGGTGLASTEDAAAAGGRYLDAGELPSVGETLDRYHLVARLGEGGMGVVFRATDADLRRDVALKLLRRGGDDTARARLLDEARAMARLQHPGVVAVHDVGSAGGHDFVTMELVAGTTLAAWLRTPRRWRDVVARFVAAGRGLAAAHAAGVIHRDFKPHNVLCGDGGRIAVADFGLALVAAADGGGGGELAGTPVYMAPEQHDGVVDARSDQFAYCVSLFEGLFGARPFTATTLSGLRAAIERGPVIPPSSPRVPARLRRAIVRGLAADASTRHRDMDALLGELDAILAARRRRLIAAAAIAVVAGGVAAVWLGRAGADAAPACTATHFAGTWPGTRRAGVEAALAAVPDIRHAVIGGLDDYAARWDARWSEMCAEETGGAPSYHAVAGCLLAGRSEVAALVDELPTLTPDTIAAAVVAIERLPDPRGCVAGPGAVLPADPAARARVREVEAALAHLRGSGVASAAERRDALARLVEDARATGHRPLIASALRELGGGDTLVGDLAAARDHLGEAALVAEEAGAADLRAAALVALAELEATFSSDPVAQARAGRQASAALDAAPASPWLRARLSLVQGRLAQAAGDLDGALAHVDEAVALLERSGATVAAASATGQRSRILRARGDAAAALAASDGALARAVGAAGPQCGACTMLRYEAAFSLHDLGRFDEAHARIDEALAIAPPDRDPPGPRKLTGRVVDRAGRPVAGVEIVASAYFLRGDPEHLVQASDRTSIEASGMHTASDADGGFALQTPDVDLVVVGRHARAGAATPVLLDAGDAGEVRLVLSPWAVIRGEAHGEQAAHVHLIPDVPAPEDPTRPGYRVEVPVIAGVWRAQVPATPHVVRLVRSDASFEATLDVATARPGPGAEVAIALTAPGDVEVEVRLRGDRAVEVPHAGLMLFPGHRGERVVNGADLMREYQQEHSATRVVETVPDGEGGSVARLAGMRPGPYTVCAAAVPGDLQDPRVRVQVMSNLSLLEGPCRHLTVAPRPAHQALTIEVPAPRRLPPP